VEAEEGDDTDDEIPDDLSPDDVDELDEAETAEAEAEEVTAEWSAETTPEQRQAVIDQYAEEGDLDVALAMLGPEHHAKFAEAAAKVEAAVTARIAKEIAPTGLTFDQLMEHMDEDYYGYYRQAAIRGDWEPFRDLAWLGVAWRVKLAEAGEL
jgi:hypothetical protein